MALRLHPSSVGRSAPVLCFNPIREEMLKLGIRLQRSFAAGRPFKHVVLDGLFPEEVLDEIVREIPDRGDQNWFPWGSGSRHADTPTAAKKGMSEEYRVGPVTRNFLLQLNSAIFIEFLRVMTGVGRLVGDADLSGGGVHSTGPGGRLLVHVDSERHPLGKPFCQSVNVIVFLNREWPESYGGHLELWSRDGKECRERILPVFNRTVIFESGTNTYHGQPLPLQCPQDRQRISLASYYYQPERALGDDYSLYRTNVQWLHDDKPTDEGVASEIAR